MTHTSNLQQVVKACKYTRMHQLQQRSEPQLDLRLEETSGILNSLNCPILASDPRSIDDDDDGDPVVCLLASLFQSVDKQTNKQMSSHCVSCLSKVI